MADNEYWVIVGIDGTFCWEGELGQFLTNQGKKGWQVAKTIHDKEGRIATIILRKGSKTKKQEYMDLRYVTKRYSSEELSTLLTEKAKQGWHLAITVYDDCGNITTIVLRREIKEEATEEELKAYRIAEEWPEDKFEEGVEEG